MEIDWEETRKHLEILASLYKKMPYESTWFVMRQLEQLKKRLNNNERTQHLHDEIMSME